MAIEKVKQEIYTTNDEGVVVLVESKEVEVEVPTKDELIADKEAKLLAMYDELKTLKGE